MEEQEALKNIVEAVSIAFTRFPSLAATGTEYSATYIAELLNPSIVTRESYAIVKERELKEGLANNSIRLALNICFPLQLQFGRYGREREYRVTFLTNFVNDKYTIENLSNRILQELGGIYIIL